MKLHPYQQINLYFNDKNHEAIVTSIFNHTSYDGVKVECAWIRFYDNPHYEEWFTVKEIKRLMEDVLNER